MSNSALLKAIQKGTKLKKSETNDRSSPIIDSKPGAGSSSTPRSGAGLSPTAFRPPNMNSPPAMRPEGLFAGGIPKLKKRDNPETNDNKSSSPGSFSPMFGTKPASPPTQSMPPAPAIRGGIPPPPAARGNPIPPPPASRSNVPTLMATRGNPPPPPAQRNANSPPMPRNNVPPPPAPRNASSPPMPRNTAPPPPAPRNASSPAMPRNNAPPPPAPRNASSPAMPRNNAPPPPVPRSKPASPPAPPAPRSKPMSPSGMRPSVLSHPKPSSPGHSPAGSPKMAKNLNSGTENEGRFTFKLQVPPPRTFPSGEYQNENPLNKHRAKPPPPPVRR